MYRCTFNSAHNLKINQNAHTSVVTAHLRRLGNYCKARPGVVVWCGVVRCGEVVWCGEMVVRGVEKW